MLESRALILGYWGKEFLYQVDVHARMRPIRARARAQVCSRGAGEADASIWLATMSGTIAVVALVRQPAPPSVPGAAAPDAVWEMVPKAEVNVDHKVHADSITHVAEVFVAAAGAAVLISGDRSGNLGARH